MQFRRLRAQIPSTYLASLLAPVRCASDMLVDGFIVEQSPYIDTLSEDCVVRTVDAIFEPFLNKEASSIKASKYCQALGEVESNQLEYLAHALVLDGNVKRTEDAG